LDSDHIGGLKSISENIEIGQIGISINNKIKEKGKVVEDIIKNEGAKRIYLKKGQSFVVDGVNFRVLLPEKKDVIDEENNDSIVILMEYQGIKTLFMGDLEAEEEEKLINNVKNLDIDILKVGHHGSITSTTENFVKSTTPSISLISVGTRFKSIPGEEVINRLKSVHSKIYRTDKNGEIVVKIDKGKMYVETRY